MTPPLTPYDIPEPPIKNYVEPFSPTPPRSVPLDEYTPYGSQPISIDAGWKYQKPRSGLISPTESQAGSPINTSNLYMPSRGRPNHMRSMTSGSTVSTVSTHSAVGSNSQYHINSQRPLPPLHHPQSYSSSPRSIDLVTPFLSAAQSPRSDASTNYDSGSELQYEKKSTLPTAGMPGHGSSLKMLFNFEAIRGRPNYSQSWSRPHTASPSPDRGSVHLSRTSSAVQLR